MTTDTQSQTKEVRIHVRSTTAELALLRQLAKHYSLTASATVHYLIAQAARKEGLTKEGLTK